MSIIHLFKFSQGHLTKYYFEQHIITLITGLVLVSPIMYVFVRKININLKIDIYI
jgi:hypothetical protein